MHTLGGMLKRFLIIGGGATLGACFFLAATQLAAAWSLFPDRKLEKQASYVREIMELVNENYVEAKDAEYDKLAQEAIRGMLKSLDPHSEFLEAKDFENLEGELSGNFSGIGVQVESRNGRIVVIAPIAGTPGERAGILRGDEVASVDGRSLPPGTPMSEVIKLLRGKPKTKVVVGLFRPGTGKTLELTLVREVIRVESVREVRVIADGIGYIQLTEFSSRTAKEFDAAVRRLLGEGITGLVLDLRNNPGGLLDAAVGVAEPFFRKGELIVYTQGRKEGDRSNYHSATRGAPLNLRLAVLINAGSASAAEVVTGALKDTGKAVVVGERSFGKGSVQSIFKLRNGEGVRLTTARYYTPAGSSIHEKGITPHVETVMTPEEDQRLRLQRVRADVTDPQEFEARFGFVPVQDRQLQTAVDVLRGVALLDERAATPAGSAAKSR